MEQTLRDLYQSLDRNVAQVANKENMTPSELETVYKAICTMEKIKKIESIEGEMNGGHSERYGYGGWPMSYENDMSNRRGRDSMGRFTSNEGSSNRRYEGGSNRGYDDRSNRSYEGQGGQGSNAMSNNYSGHSFNDRMIAQLEVLYDQAQTEHDRNRLREEIDRLRMNPQ